MEVHYNRKHPNQFNIFALNKKQITDCNFNNSKRDVFANQVNFSNQSNLVNPSIQPYGIIQQNDNTSLLDFILSQLDQTNEVELIIHRIKKLNQVQLMNLMVKLYPVINPNHGLQ